MIFLVLAGAGAMLAGETAGGDWPMWRYDPARSAQTPHRLSETLHLHWVRELPAPRRAWPWQVDEQGDWGTDDAKVTDRGRLDFDVSYSPVAAGGLLFVPSNVTDSVTAYDLEDGSERWRFYADGPVRLAPAVWEGRVYVTSDDGHLYCLDAETGALAWKFRAGPSRHSLLGNERIINYWAARGGPLVHEGTVYFAAGVFPLHGVFVYALDAESGEVVWVNDSTSTQFHGWVGQGSTSPQGYIAVDDERLIVSGGRTWPLHLDRGTGEILDARAEGAGYGVHAGGAGIRRNEMLQKRLDSVKEQIDGEVFYKLTAAGRLVVSTVNGTIYCFGPEQAEALRYDYAPRRLDHEPGAWSAIVQNLLEGLGEREGYALVLGAGSGALVRELLLGSEMHVVIIESDAGRVRELRDELSAAGKYGRRAAVIEADPADFRIQPYLFSLILSEDVRAAGIEADTRVLGEILNRLRPYGGRAWLEAPQDTVDRLVEAASAAEVDKVSVRPEENGVLAQRDGPLTGADDWTHENKNAAGSNVGNDMVSMDERVRAPLGILWFGGPSNVNVLRRHGMGPRQHVVAGLQIVPGGNTVSARCVYTGREVWERKFPGIGNPFTVLRAEEGVRTRRQGTILPGVYRYGPAFASRPDSVYVRYDEHVHRLDIRTGRTLGMFELPGRPLSEVYDDDSMEDWGYVGVTGDYLIVSAEPYMFDGDQNIFSRRPFMRRVGSRAGASGMASRVLAVMNRYSGEVLWTRRAAIGFMHRSILAHDGMLRLLDGVNEDVRVRMLRTGREVPRERTEYLLSLADGSESDMSVEQWMQARPLTVDRLLEDVEHEVARARRGWGDHPVGDDAAAARVGKGCGPYLFSRYMVTFRSGSGAYFDLEYGSGNYDVSAVRAGCTNTYIPADGVLNGLDYTRTCNCAYPLQTSFALVHMPDDSNVEFWGRRNRFPRDPANHGLNFGAPGRRVDVAGTGLVWYDHPGTRRRHPSAVKDAGNSIAWVGASVWEPEGDDFVTVGGLETGRYDVKLHFCELQGNVRAGERVFDVLIAGELVLEGFDIVRESGGSFRALAKTFSVTSADGTITVELHKRDGSRLGPSISGIELRKRL